MKIRPGDRAMERPGEGTLLGENLNHSFISEASCMGLRVGAPKESSV
jgi:hypothetical protein